MKYCGLFLVSLLIASCCTTTTTYIPEQFTQINYTKDNKTICVTDSAGILTVESPEKDYAITVFYENVDRNKVKAIKQAKMNLGMATFSKSWNMNVNSASGVSYYLESAKAEAAAAANVANEMKLGIFAVINNYSQEDLFVANMTNGLSCTHIPAESRLTIPLNNPENIQLRITNIDPVFITADAKKPEVAYVAITAHSKVNKRILAYEDNACWVYKVYEEVSSNYYATRYVKISKDTFRKEILSHREYMEYINKK